MNLNLLVLRADDMESLAGFYSTLFDCELVKHRHGKGPEHFGADIHGLIFEIYTKRDSSDDTTAIRFGFKVDDLAQSLERIKHYGINIVSAPKESPWGLRSVIDDPEGHRIELIQ